jgi:hypothetical protein
LQVVYILLLCRLGCVLKLKVHCPFRCCAVFWSLSVYHNWFLLFRLLAFNDYLLLLYTFTNFPCLNYLLSSFNLWSTTSIIFASINFATYLIYLLFLCLFANSLIYRSSIALCIATRFGLIGNRSSTSTTALLA